MLFRSSCQCGGAPALRPGAIAQSPGREAALAWASPRGPATSTGSVASQRHPGKFTKVPGRRRGKRGFPAAPRQSKSRDITLPTKVHLVKAMVFPVVIYGCKSWTIKKAEPQRIDTFDLQCWRRLLRVPWTARRSNQSILKEISPGSPPDRDRRGDSPAWSGRGSRPSRRTSG